MSQWVVELPATVSLVAAGMGAALLPKSLHKLFSDRVVFRSLGNGVPHADVYAVQHKADTSVVLQEFVRFFASSA